MFVSTDGFLSWMTAPDLLLRHRNTLPQSPKIVSSVQTTFVYSNAWISSLPVKLCQVSLKQINDEKILFPKPPLLLRAQIRNLQRAMRRKNENGSIVGETFIWSLSLIIAVDGNDTFRVQFLPVFERYVCEKRSILPVAIDPIKEKHRSALSLLLLEMVAVVFVTV
jgi:hypothetical protein